MHTPAFFELNGFAVLPQAIPHAVIDEVLERIDAKKRDRPFDLVIDLLDTGERTVLGLLSPEDAATVRLKINDLFLSMPEIRDLALTPAVLPVLKSLLGQTPVLCNSLYLERGSEQPPHVDAIFMTPRTPKHLIATWVALENTHADAGPLEYFPGSHLIEPMTFSNGQLHFVESEMPQWHTYMDQAVEKAGLKSASFAAKKGDVFIWHANLLHGGGPIRNPALTRKSLVFHFYSEQDCRADGSTLVPQAGAYWLKRPTQSVPEAVAAQIAGKLEFSESGYLDRYPDVANAVAAGSFESGLAHYQIFGKDEGRLPC